MLGNLRRTGITEFLHEYVGLGAVVLFSVITQLGDVWFLFLLGGLLYITGDAAPLWGVDRRQGLFVLALVITYVALIGVLKNVFMLPRPPGAGEPPGIEGLPMFLEGLFRNITTATGPGFPSGHALGTTMVWGGLALVLDRGRLRTRLAGAGAVVALVALSRLVIGVHYAADVVVGFALGAVVLGGLYLLADDGTDPARVFLFAVGVGALGLFQGLTFDSVAALGSAVGGLAVWYGIAEATPHHPRNRREVAVAFAVCGLAAALFGVVYTVDASLLVTFLGTAAAVGGVVGAPLVGERAIEQPAGERRAGQ